MNRVIKQNHYPTLTVDTDENDIIQIAQNGKEDFNLIMIEKENVGRFVKLLCPELSQPELKAVKTAEIDRLAHDVLNYFFDGDWADLDKDEIKKLINDFIDRISNQLSQPKEGQPEIIRTDNSKVIEQLTKELEQAKELIKNSTMLMKQDFAYRKHNGLNIGLIFLESQIELNNEFLEGTKTK